MTWTKEEEAKLLEIFDDMKRANVRNLASKACTRYRQINQSKKRDDVKKKLSELRRARGDFAGRATKSYEWGEKNYPDTRGIHQIRMAERIFSELDRLKADGR